VKPCEQFFLNSPGLHISHKQATSLTSSQTALKEWAKFWVGVSQSSRVHSGDGWGSATLAINSLGGIYPQRC
jgi:hypothetical protein